MNYCNVIQSASLKVMGVFTWVLNLATDLLGASKSPSVELTDEELVNLLNNGNDSAFDELYERYFGRIFAFTMRRVGHHQNAEDIVSKVFMKAFGARKRLKVNSSFSAWIYTITNNAITDFYRTKKEFLEIDAMTERKLKEDPDVEQFLDNETLRKVLETATEKLDERSRLVLTMKFYSQMSHQEIAETLEIEANHVGVIAHRALKKCKKWLPETFYN